MATDDGFVLIISISKGGHAIDPAGFFPKSRRGIAPVTDAAIAVVLLDAGDPAVDKYVVFCFKIVQHGRNDFLIEHGIPDNFSEVIVQSRGEVGIETGELKSGIVSTIVDMVAIWQTCVNLDKFFKQIFVVAANQDDLILIQ